MSKAGVFACRLVVGVVLLAMQGCMVGWFNLYALRAEIVVDPEHEPLSAKELEKLRSITEEIADEEGLQLVGPLEQYFPSEVVEQYGQEDRSRYEIYNLYRPSPPSPYGRTIALYVEKGRRYAHIHLHDDAAAGDVSEWVRNVMNRVVLKRLSERLSDRPVEVEKIDLGLYTP